MELNSAFGGSELGSSSGSSRSSDFDGKGDPSPFVVDNGEGLFVCLITPFKMVGDDLEGAVLVLSW